MFIVTTYIAYLAISIAVTVWVGQTLYRRGRVFLIDAFHGNVELAESTNHLLIVGFYLLNIGYVNIALRESGDPQTVRACLELLSGKIGVVLLILAFTHFFNMYVASRIRRRALNHYTHPPVEPNFQLPR